MWARRNGREMARVGEGILANGPMLWAGYGALGGRVMVALGTAALGSLTHKESATTN
jgi:hypothetical protein